MNEVLRRIREKSDRVIQDEKDREIELMGPYNAFSRPKQSSNAPLRTMLLDPEVNNFPRSRTRSELMKRIRAAAIPHPSYDLDNDGYVSTEDYRLAKRFDLDGNGVLDKDEREIGKRVLAEEFFKRHAHELHLFGRNIAHRTHSENVEKLVNSYSFERTYGKLRQVERTLIAESSGPMIACMSDNIDPVYKSTNYFTDKMDATAWNDLDRLPRSVLSESLNFSLMASSPARPSTAPAQRQGQSAPAADQRTSSSIVSSAVPSAMRPGSARPNFVATNNITHAPGYYSMSSSLFSANHPSNISLHSGSRKRLLFARKEVLRHDSQEKMGKNEKWPGRSFGRVKMISDVRVENS